jgi:hypothetical protein
MEDRRHDSSVKSGPCGELRRSAESACARAAELKEAAAAARTALQVARRELVRVQHTLEEARGAADPARVSRGKAAARSAYRRAIASSALPADRQRAAAEWLREIDRLNREGRRANRALSKTESVLRQLARQAFEAERQTDAARIAWESAAALCADTRQQLAACEGSPEQLIAITAPRDTAWDGQPVAESGQPAINGNARDSQSVEPAAGGSAAGENTLSTSLVPLVVERLAYGDRETFRTVSAELSGLTGHPVSHYLLLLQELVDAVRMVAAERHFLAFEDAHPLWTQFNREERQAIMAALADLGFRYDHEEGWYGGRAPGTSEMAVALAYAGHDPRTIRRQLSSDELRALPQSVTVSPVDCLAALAPDLTLSQMFELLGPRADTLGPLWDDWGRLRPVLLSEVAAFASA